MNYSKKLATISALAVAILSSCIEEKDLSQISKVPEPETYSEVTFNIGGECSTTETPLSRATNEKKTFMVLLFLNGSETQVDVSKVNLMHMGYLTTLVT